MQRDYLPLGVRAHTVAKSKSRSVLPEALLVFDTETSADPAQALNFGTCRYLRVSWNDGKPDLRPVGETLFYGDDLPERDPDGFEVIRSLQGSAPRVDRRESGAAWRLEVMPRQRFIDEIFLPLAYEARAWVVAFNLPFDLSRLAWDAGPAGGDYAGGFSLRLGAWEPAPGDRREHRWRPRIAIRTIDSKRHLMGFKRPIEIEERDQIPEGERRADPGYAFAGHFLDLRTLAFALTDKGGRLEDVCGRFGVAYEAHAERHGVIDAEYIDYNRDQVDSTCELFGALMREHLRHPIELDATRTYSPATIGKAYLRSMGVRPVLERQPEFPPEVLGYGMAAYYGGRTECRIRRTEVPVAYLDFLSMYPTVNSLMDLWRLVTCQWIEVVDATDEIRQLLQETTLESCFEPQRWKQFAGLVQLKPSGDLLPARSRYLQTASLTRRPGEARRPNPSWQIGLNPLTYPEPLWYAIPDAVGATVLGDKPPEVVQALRFVPHGEGLALTPTALRGAVEIDPHEQDFFRAVIEERKLLDTRALPAEEHKRLDRFLKVLANSASYGIYAEIVRHEHRRSDVDVHGAESAFVATGAALEEPGAFSFPPMAACITAAARLMLALTERLVAEHGGSYAFCDTDSMAVITSEHGGLVRCNGGAMRTPSGGAAVKALSWDEVDEIRAQFEDLNPYRADAVDESVLELEDENYEDPQRTQRRQLYCFSISAKRYALYTRADDGRPQLRPGTDELVGEKWSEHGLGHLLNPSDPDPERANKDWIRELWLHELEREDGCDPAEPPWFELPAIGPLTVSQYSRLTNFRGLNKDASGEPKPYAQRIKPFNFMLAAHAAIAGLPAEADPQEFQLIAPYERDPREWLSAPWIDRATGERTEVTTEHGVGAIGLARIKDFRETFADYRVRREAKALAPDGGRSGWHTRGLLQRRPVQGTRLINLGKESNLLEESTASVIHNLDDVQNEYQPQDPLLRHILPVIRKMPRDRLKPHFSGTTLAQLRAEPPDTPLPTLRRNARRKLTQLASDYAAEELTQLNIASPPDPADCCAAYLQASGAGVAYFSSGR